MTNLSQIALSVIDQSPIRKGGTPSEALWESVNLARHAEKVGYSRYWVAEHHNSSSFAGTSPEILIGQIAAHTTSIRIGSGGVMLSHYSALKVAEQFSILGSLYPGRIDLGIGRAPGSDGLTAAALAFPRARMNVARDFPQVVEDLVGFLHGGLKEPHPLAGIKVQPGESDGIPPEVWLLGSSDYSAKLAAAIGLPFSFADFFGNTGEHGPQIADIYRNEFRPSVYLSKPRVNVALQVICARTKAEARFIGASRSLNKMVSVLGLTTDGLLPPEEAMKWPMDNDTKAYMSQATKSYIEGDLDEVRAGILKASKRYQTSDIGIVTNCYDFEHRKRSYALVAECIGVTPSGAYV